MTTNTFDGTEIQVRQLLDFHKEGSDAFEVTFDCVTTDLTKITALTAKMGTVTKSRLIDGRMSVQTTGTKGTLVLNGTSYTNCVITDIRVKELFGTRFGGYSYTISFARETVT